MPKPKKSKSTFKQPSWLPIDFRLVPNIISFGKVTPLARIFLTIEIILASLVVLGSLILAIYQLLILQ